MYFRNMMYEENCFVSPSTSGLRVMRDGRSILLSAGIPKPIVLVDTRKQEEMLTTGTGLAGSDGPP